MENEKLILRSIAIILKVFLAESIQDTIANMEEAKKILGEIDEKIKN